MGRRANRGAVACNGQANRLVTGGADGRYVSTGHLVYVRLGTLMAAPFDPVRLVVTGGATGLIDGVMQAANRNLSEMENTLAGQFTVSETGALVYVTGGVVPAAERPLAWVDRQGTSQALPAPPRSYTKPHDYRPTASTWLSPPKDIRQVWSYDIARGALNPVTGDGQSSYGIFAPDGKRVVFRSSAAGGEDNLYWKAADGSGAAERLTTSARSQTPASWSPDGTTLAFVEEGDPGPWFSVRYLGVVDWGSQDSCGSPDGRQRNVARVFPGRPLAGVCLQRIRTQRSLRAAISGPRRASPDFNQRRRATSVGQQWPRTVLCARRGGRQPTDETRVRQHPDGPGIPGGNTRNAIRKRRSLERLGKKLRRRAGWTAVPDRLRKDQPNLAPAQMIFVQNWFEELKRLVPVN